MKIIKLLPLLLLLLFFQPVSCFTVRAEQYLYPIEQQQLYGYIDKQGDIIIEPKFKSASRFSEGYALVLDSNEEFFYLDSEGELYPLPTGVSLSDLFFDGRARALKDGKVGYLQAPEFSWVIEPQWQAAGRFSEGKAAVLLSDKQFGYIDRKGELLFSLKASAVGNFNQGRAWFIDKQLFGIVDQDGSLIVAAKYNWIGDYHDGLAKARISDGLYGYLDLEGQWQIEPAFSRAENFSEKLALVYNHKTQAYGYINPSGEFEITAIFFDGGQFVDGYSWVRDGESFYYIDRSGQSMPNQALLKTNNFYQGLAKVQDKTGTFYLNLQGEEVWRSIAKVTAS